MATIVTTCQVSVFKCQFSNINIQNFYGRGRARAKETSKENVEINFIMMESKFLGQSLVWKLVKTVRLDAKCHQSELRSLVVKGRPGFSCNHIFNCMALQGFCDKFGITV